MRTAKKVFTCQGNSHESAKVLGIISRHIIFGNDEESFLS